MPPDDSLLPADDLTARPRALATMPMRDRPERRSWALHAGPLCAAASAGLRARYARHHPCLTSSTRPSASWAAAPRRRRRKPPALRVGRGDACQGRAALPRHRHGRAGDQHSLRRSASLTRGLAAHPAKHGRQVAQPRTARQARRASAFAKAGSDGAGRGRHAANGTLGASAAFPESLSRRINPVHLAKAGSYSRD